MGYILMRLPFLEGGNSHLYFIIIIYHYFLLVQVQREQEQQLVFTIPIFDPMPNQYYVKAVSDRWLNCESTCVMSFEKMILPEQHPPHTGKESYYLFLYCVNLIK